jgi:hypothetical protein
MASITVDALDVAIGAAFYSFKTPTTLQLAEGVNTVFATASGVNVTTGTVVSDQQTLLLYQATVVNGVLQGTVDLRQFGGIDVSQYATGNLPLSNNSLAVQSTILASGGINLGSTLNAGTVPYGGMPNQFVSTINQFLDPASASFVGLNTISTPQVQAVSIISHQLSQTVYDTSWLANQLNGPGSFQWRWATSLATFASTSAPATPTTSLPNNAYLKYDVQSNTDAGSRGVSADTLLLAANASATFEFDHAPFVTGADGLNAVTFVGSSVSTAANVLNTLTSNDSDLPAITHTTVPNPTNVLQALSFGNPNAFVSTPTVTQVPHTTFSVNRHSAGSSGPFVSTGSVVAPHVGTNGAAIFVGRFPANTFAPTGPASQIVIDIGAVTTSGYFNANVWLANPENTVVLAVWNNVVSGQELVYYAAGATGGAYWLWMSAVEAYPGPPSWPPEPGSYPVSVSIGSETWYQSDATTTFTYQAVNGISLSSNVTAVAPTTQATEITLTVSTLVTTNINGNVSGLFATLTNPYGAVIVSQAITSTGSYTYWQPTAVAGQYSWTIYGFVATNAQNESVSLPVTASGSVGYYALIDEPITTYFQTTGALKTYATPTSTLAPTTAATQLTFNVNSVITPANAAGTSYVVTYLLSPTGISIPFEKSDDNGVTWFPVILWTVAQWGANAYLGAVNFPRKYRYINPNASAGAYTWVAYGFAKSNLNGDSSYAVSWNSTIGYYLVGVAGGNVYILGADGTTQRPATNDTQITFTEQSADSYAFRVTNSAGSALSFTIACETLGV